MQPFPLNEQEQCYQRLYSRMPEKWSEPFADWQEMIQRAHAQGVTDIPEEAPSYMDSHMEENGVFLNGETEVQCFLNVRYCPPFLHRLGFLKIVYVLSGQVQIYVQEKRYHLTAGSFCIVAPEVEHTVFSCADEDRVVNILMRTSSFTSAFSELLMEGNILSEFFWKWIYQHHTTRILVFVCQRDEELERFVLRMLQDSSEDRPGTLMMKHYAMLFLAGVMRSHLQDLRSIDVPDQSIYQMPAIIRYIREHLDTVTAAELQEAFHMSETALRSYVTKESGYHLNELLRHERLERVAYLLRNTHLSVERIAEETGYSSVTHLYRHFKQRFGVTPQAYREHPMDTI